LHLFLSLPYSQSERPLSVKGKGRLLCIPVLLFLVPCLKLRLSLRAAIERLDFREQASGHRFYFKSCDFHLRAVLPGVWQHLQSAVCFAEAYDVLFSWNTSISRKARKTAARSAFTSADPGTYVDMDELKTERKAFTKTE